MHTERVPALRRIEPTTSRPSLGFDGRVVPPDPGHSQGEYNPVLFFNNIPDDPVYYFTVVICVTLSIVLHELGHGFAAIQQGDDTPIATGHMTWTPLVHMGPMGLGLLCVVGIAFGVMPVNPRRFRDPFGDAFVAAAGPLVNGVLAILSLTTLALLIKQGIDPRVAGVDPLWIRTDRSPYYALGHFFQERAGRREPALR